MPNDHFVPRHYLRRFEYKPGSELIAVATIVPPRFVGVRGIGGQCCEDGFYENNKGVENLIGTSENDLAPVLVNVVKKKDFNEKEMNALKLLAVIFNMRTKKAVEWAKMFPKYYAKSAIEEATKQGQLPSLPEGFSIQNGVDFEGMPAILMHQIIPCLMEAQTLSAKLVKAEQGAFFITSDNPAVVLNQYCVGIDRVRSFAGYSCTGFQLLMPISPDLCLIIYDASVYKIGSQKHRVVNISKDDVEIINSLQVQSAENFLYFHVPERHEEIKNLIGNFGKYRQPIESGLETLPGTDENEELIKVSNLVANLPKKWEFCRYRRRIAPKPGSKRNPGWSQFINVLIDDIERNPKGGNIFARMEKICGHKFQENH